MVYEESLCASQSQGFDMCFMNVLQQQQKSPKQNDDSNGVICEPPLMFNRFRILSQNYRKNVFFAGDNESVS